MIANELEAKAREWLDAEGLVATDADMLQFGERLGALLRTVAAEERAACEAVAREREDAFLKEHDVRSTCAQWIAEAIRKRGEKGGR